MENLDVLRKKINETDAKMRELFLERMEAVRGVAEYKRATGTGITDPAREAEMIERNSLLVEEELRPYYVSFLKNNIEVSKQYQRRLLTGARVAVSGVPGSFAHIAAKKVFPLAETVGCGNFQEAYAAAESGECDYALLPIENSSNGDVSQVMDLIYFGNLFVNDVHDIAVVQNLLAVPGAALSDIRTVISHPQALGQCADFIRDHGLETVEFVNTAAAAKEVAERGDRSVAAIGSETAAGEYGLVNLVSHINTAMDNTTRFAVLSKSMKEPAAKDNRFLLLFTVRDEAGALVRALSALAEYGFNMRSLKSRPDRTAPWSYYFFCECEGNIESENGWKMLQALQSVCENIKMAGSFE